MKTSCATLFLLSILGGAEPGRAQDLESEPVSSMGTKECGCLPATYCKITILGIRAIDAEVLGDSRELADVDGDYMELSPYDQAAPFGLDVEFQLTSCSQPFRQFFLRIVTEAPPVIGKISLMNLETEQFDDIQEVKMFRRINDFVTRVDDPSPYLSEADTIYLRLSYLFFPTETSGLEPRGANKIGIDLDKIEIFE